MSDQRQSPHYYNDNRNNYSQTSYNSDYNNNNDNHNQSQRQNSQNYHNNHNGGRAEEQHQHPATHVASHYNARPQVGVDQRRDSVIIQMKSLNNWIKSVLISKYISRGAVVLDYCCGKGGDLQKWKLANISRLIGVDIAEVSIQHATQRFNEARFKFPARFFALDCFSHNLLDYLEPDERSFDLVSCQFALHYSAESKEKATLAIANVAAVLKPGGYFIGTVPCAYRLIKRLRRAPGLSFGNSIYNVTFDSKESYPLYGHRYFFELADAIDNCPEYVFNFPAFARLADEHGLELCLRQDFHEFFDVESKIGQNEALLHKMRVFNAEGTISADEWEASGLYMVFAFRKR